MAQKLHCNFTKYFQLYFWKSNRTQYCDVSLSQAANDLNFHTPMDASLASIPPAPQEFGAYVESEVFGKQVAWYESASTLEENGKQYITSFIAAIEENVSIPNYFVKDQLVARYESPYSCSSSGMDLEVQYEVF